MSTMTFNSQYEQLGFVRHKLDETYDFYTGKLPDELRFGHDDFQTLWEMHPAEHTVIMMHGKPVPIPRWQQAYGQDYHFSGKDSHALPVSSILKGLLDWAKSNIDESLNGLLLNWYDASKGHYIGRHRDSIANMVKGCPIVTVSLGESRIFRMCPWKGKGNIDFEASDGCVFVTPYLTNLAFTHAVPMRAAYCKQRISITLRGFHT